MDTVRLPCITGVYSAEREVRDRGRCARHECNFSLPLASRSTFLSRASLSMSDASRSAMQATIRPITAPVTLPTFYKTQTQIQINDSNFFIVWINKELNWIDFFYLVSWSPCISFQSSVTYPQVIGILELRSFSPSSKRLSCWSVIYRQKYRKKLYFNAVKLLNTASWWNLFN